MSDNHPQKNRIPSDPKQLADRLNQPPVTRLEALKQVAASVPLHPSAQAELDALEAEAQTGPSADEWRPAFAQMPIAQ